MAQKGTYTITYPFKRLLELLKTDKKEIYAIYFFALFAGIIQLSLPLGIQSIISFVQAGSISTSIFILIFIVIGGVLLNGLLQIRQMEIIEKIEQKIFAKYSITFSEKIPQLKLDALHDYYLPELTNRYFDVVTLVKSNEKILLHIPAALIQIIIGIILLSLYHPLFIGFGLFLLTVLFTYFKYSSSKGFASSIQTSDDKYKIAGWIQEEAVMVNALKFAQENPAHIKKTDHLLSNYLSSRSNHFKILLGQYWSFISFKLLLTAGMLILGTFLLIDQQINVGQFIAADIVIIAIINSVEKLIGSLDVVYDVLTSIQKLGKIADAELEESGNIILEKQNQGLNIEFKNTTYTLHNKVKIINNLNLQINAGEKVCFIGNSGSGKTTILKLLTGSHSNYTGSIHINAIPLQAYQLDSYRKNISMFFNTNDIFEGSVLENILLFPEHKEVEDVLTLAEKLKVKSYINELSEGVYTQIKAYGNSLSNKQKKVILLLRALIASDHLILLDEPFTYLNEAESDALFDYLKQQHATVLITATSLNKPYSFNRTISLKNGAIVSSTN